MDISINVGYFGPHITDNHKLIKELDDLEISCVWTAEAYGYDAVTPLAYFAALTTNMDMHAVGTPQVLNKNISTEKNI